MYLQTNLVGLTNKELNLILIHGMRKFQVFIALVFFLCSFGALCQYSSNGGDSKALKTFGGTKTFAILTGNAEFDEVFKQSLDSIWKHTSISFMTEQEFKENIGNTSYSFIAFLKISEPGPSSSNNPTIQTSLFHGNSAIYAYSLASEGAYLCLINGGKKDLRNYDLADMAAYCPLDFYFDENIVSRCRYRVPIMIKNLHTTISVLKEQGIKGSDRKLNKQLASIYNEKKTLVKTKKLLVIAQSVPLLKEDVFKSVYPYEVVYCTKEEMEKAILEKNKNYLAFIPCHSVKSSQFIFDIETYDCVYADYDNRARMIKKRDIKRLVKRLKV